MSFDFDAHIEKFLTERVNLRPARLTTDLDVLLSIPHHETLDIYPLLDIIGSKAKLLCPYRLALLEGQPFNDDLKAYVTANLSGACIATRYRDDGETVLFFHSVADATLIKLFSQ